MRLFRRQLPSNVWHFCRECSKWPSRDYWERKTEPITGELCEECRRKAQVSEQES